MIIGREEIYDVQSFLAGLEASVRGVVRVKVESGRYGSAGADASGWLITDRLVVVPDFVAADVQDSKYFCQQGRKSLVAELVLAGMEGGDGSGPALLRLAEPLEGRALTLASEATKKHDQLFLLHYPRGAAEPHLSVGRQIGSDGPFLRYDADTTGGSSGAPVLSAGWAVVAMHTGSNRRESATYNKGLSLSALLAPVRETPFWQEIARHHKLVDVAAIRSVLEEPDANEAPPTNDTDLLGAAVRWTFDPDTFPADARERLRSLVAEPSAPQWSLPAGERATLLKSAGTLDVLRKARGSETLRHPGQRVIDRILRGPPYSLDEVSEGALPYWLQATHWFAEVVPELPSALDVNRTLERRRMRSRLEEIGGRGFRGRASELEQLREWYDDVTSGPMVVTGIGGVGKSALVARFALDLPDDTLLLWLDFDRPDVAPDDAISVLRQLFDQMATQLDRFAAPALDPASWPDAVAALGPALRQQLSGVPAPLLVLDGFEVAQYVKEHREIWQLLEQLLPQIPGARVLVSGRAPVVGLELGGRPAHDLHLAGLAEPDAKAWLRGAGITDDRVVDRVVEITRGVPLALRLAVRWTEAGGVVSELPEELPDHLVDGFLYQRILDRVIDPLLKPVAQDALVLRRLTPEMTSVVLSDRLPEGLDAEEVFARLAREMSLVGDGAVGVSLDQVTVAVSGTAALRLRPEVRSATLRLLETDKPERVRTIDERAADWYAQQDPDDVANAAELVYHRLRLGDVQGADQAWREGCAPLLLYADEEFPEDAQAARAWLRDRTVVATTPADDLTAWEHNAHERVVALNQRGLLQPVDAVLAERRERSVGSPLVLFDAFMRWWSGDLPGARVLLDEAPRADGAVLRDRLVLGARLAAEAGDRREADERLRAAAAESWDDRPEPALDALSMEAARVRLTIDLERELALTQSLRSDRPDVHELWLTINQMLSPSDVVMPALADLTGGMVAVESTGEAIRVPRDPSELGLLAYELDRARASALTIADQGSVPPPANDPWHGSELAVGAHLPRAPKPVEPAHESALDLAVLGWRRWRLVTSTLFLVHACDQAVHLNVVDPQRASILGTLAAFAGHDGSSFTLWYGDGGPVRNVLDVVAKHGIPPAPPPRARQLTLAASVMETHGGLDQRKSLAASAQKAASATAPIALGEFPPHLQSLALLLLSPDPLDLLVRRLVGVPDTFPLWTQP